LALLWRRFLEHRLAVASAVALAVVALLVLLAPAIEAVMGLDAGEVDLYNRFAGPSLAHPVGTDELGRDLFAGSTPSSCA
jgi:peptide/nickel transport system permease protein